MDSQQTYAAVSEHYSSVSSNTAQLGEDYAKTVAESFGYTKEELASIPAESNLGVSCGNPLGTANLKEVQAVVSCLRTVARLTKLNRERLSLISGLAEASMCSWRQRRLGQQVDPSALT